MRDTSSLSGARLAWYALATVLAVFTYFYALDGQNTPRNGDEDPYTHITRMTAQSGHWLPLQSNLDGMRNTKPPLLFWQGIASTDWGRDWTLWNLRYPSVLYTLATAALVFALAWKLSAQLEAGFIAALTFLAFFSTYRFGRPFLVNPAETFWFFVPFFLLLYGRPRSFESRVVVPLAMGVAVGIGLLYKSFALLAPVGLGLMLWYWQQREFRLIETLRRDAYKLVTVGVLALALFALWFALDPDPASVWREFVVGENAGKFGASDGYWATFFRGGSSVWTMLFAYPFNAGLLAFPVFALFIFAWRQRRQLTDAEKMLWLWLLVLLTVFSVPSQRSSRYLLEAMPMLAVLCALRWPQLHRASMVASLLLCGVFVALLVMLSWGLQQEAGAQPLYGMAYWLVVAATVAVILIGLVSSRATRAVTPVAALMVLLSLAAFLRPFDGALGVYDEAAVVAARANAVWVPCNFRAKDETFRFILPGADVHGYDEDDKLTTASLAQRYPLFAFRTPLDQTLACAECDVIGSRYVIRSRQSDAEFKAMLKGEVTRHLFAKEWLVKSTVATAGDETTRPKDGCR